LQAVDGGAASDAVENAFARVMMAVLIVPTAAKGACGNRAKLLDVTPRRIRLTRGQVMRVKVEERCRGRAQWAIHRAGAHFCQVSCRQ
jgi:hypothetical protein